MNWRDLKPGDRVRVTFEKPVHSVRERHITLGSELDKAALNNYGADAATWELLSRPLKIGRAKHWPSGHSCQVLAIHEGLAWIKYDRGGYETISVHHFENIDEEPRP